MIIFLITSNAIDSTGSLGATDSSEMGTQYIV